MRTVSIARYSSFLLAMLCAVQLTKAHIPDSLLKLPGYSFEIFYSRGHEARAMEIAGNCEKAMSYMSSKVFNFSPTIKVFVLDTADWRKQTTMPVYGMPHATQDKRLIVAAEDNPFWKSFIPAMETLSDEMAKTIIQVYRRPDGELSMGAFFDLLALHELAHHYHLQSAMKFFPRKWLNELFANIFLHTYIAENEPGLLPALETFPRMVVQNGTQGFKHTSLEDFELFYGGKMHPKNYGWYQSRLHMAAKEIYEAEGINVLKNLWDLFSNNPREYTDKELLEILSLRAPSVAKMMKNWGVQN